MFFLLTRLTARMTLLVLAITFLPPAAAAEHISRSEYAVLEKTYRLLEKEQFGQCLKAVAPLLTKKHPSSHAFSYASLCHAHLGEHTKAMKVLQRAVQLYPDNRDFQFNRGIFQMQAEEFSGAVKSFTALLELGDDQQEGIIRYNLAFAHYRLEHYREALTAIFPVTEVIAAKRHWLMLRIYCEIGLGDWVAAEKTGLRMLSAEPSSTQSWTLLGQIAINRQDHSRATAYLEIAHTLAPGKGVESLLGRLYGVQSAWNELIRYKRLQGAPPTEIAEKLAVSCQYRAAIEELNRSSAEPDKRSALLKGQLLFWIGDNERAVKQLLDVELLPLDPSDDSSTDGSNLKEERRRRDRLSAQALLLAGQILWLDHEWEQARNVFKRLELLPGWKEQGRALADCMQQFLQEKQRAVTMPDLYDPPFLSEAGDAGQP